MTIRVVDSTPKLTEQEPSAGQNRGFPHLGQEKNSSLTLVTPTGAGVAELIKAEFQV